MTRSALRLLLAGTILVTVPTAAQDSVAAPDVQASHLAGTLHRLVCAGEVNMVASVGPDGILLVDTGYGATVEAVRTTLEELGGGPVRIVVNTHSDGDHIGGNALLGDGAVILGHSAIRERQGTYFALPPVAQNGLPTITLDEGAIIHFNGDVIRIIPIPGGHTDADLVVHFTGAGVACLGDLVISDAFPSAPPARGGDARTIAPRLRQVLEMVPDATVLVAGHGRCYSADDLRRHIEMVEATVAAVEKRTASGASLDEILASGTLAPWQQWSAPNGLAVEDWTSEIYASLAGNQRQSICKPVTEVLVKDGLDAALARYRQLRRDAFDAWDFDETQLNVLGYQLLQRNLIDEAIAIFQLNVEAYPDGFNTHDSLGEAYLAGGQKGRAIACYRRSLALNPENDNARRVLERLADDR